MRRVCVEAHVWGCAGADAEGACAEGARAGRCACGGCVYGGRARRCGGCGGCVCGCARGSADAKGMCADVPGAAQPRVSKLKHARSTYQCGRLTDGAHYRVASPRHCQQACLPRAHATCACTWQAPSRPAVGCDLLLAAALARGGRRVRMWRCSGPAR